jgi:hypothetical protein
MRFGYGTGLVAVKCYQAFFTFVTGDQPKNIAHFETIFANIQRHDMNGTRMTRITRIFADLSLYPFILHVLPSYTSY